VPFRPVSAQHARQVLELDAAASGADIKRAYRRLAMRWHPDRNTAPEAADRFRQVRAAYDYLLEGGDEADAADGMSEAEDAPARGPDQREFIDLSVEEAIFGCEHEFSLGEAVACAECDGAGTVHLARSRLCTACHGSGRIRTAGGLDRCALCDGRGYVSVVPCGHCEGSGQVHAARRIRVRVPPLMWPGRGVRLAGQAAPVDGLPPGDLLLVARLLPHALFSVAGDVLSLRMPVSGLALLAGAQLQVPVPGAVASLSLAPGTVTVDPQRLAGHGLPRRDGGRGELLVHLEPVWPRTLGPEDLDVLAALRAHFDARAEALMPELAQWQARWLGEAAAPSGRRRKRRDGASEQAPGAKTKSKGKSKGGGKGEGKARKR
jgi:molecular chaperone DnaJ